MVGHSAVYMAVLSAAKPGGSKLSDSGVYICLTYTGHIIRESADELSQVLAI